MELSIGTKLRTLRRGRDLTQEEVAAHLGISFQAVSKWERGDGYPDITLLPALARYFGVTTDELLGVDEIAAAEKYREINRIWQENRTAGRHAENVTLMRESLKRYPNDALLLVQLSTSLERLDGTEEEKAAHLRESIAVQEQILRYGEDSEVRNATQYNLCFAYLKNGEPHKALEQAKKLGNLYKSRENALVYLLEGEERRAVSRMALEPLKWVLETHLTILAEEDERWKERLEKILALMEG
ncbi:MAG: helix-turn-helix transcriptional regulator [Oscillospiraceae bacterium]|nr:helix-turn-helix transcriptional regulator [Oscillospiraceae bacterium]